MKLIDIVILELSKRGGWPEKSACVVQDADTQICFSAKTDGLRKVGTDWIGGEWNGPWANFFSNHLADDHATSIVTKEQYEAALAASKPEWDGEGLPPVGCVCEVKVCGGYEQCEIVFSNPKSGVAYIYLDENEHGGKRPVDCISPIPAPLYFRPIRSEAEKRRDEAAKGLIEYLDKETDIDNVFSINDVISFYDAIAAGKIPHIRID